MKSLISGDLAASVVDSLTSSICVVDLTGAIVAVNRAWVAFSSDNAGDTDNAYLGANYFDHCRLARGPASREAAKFCHGLRSVLEGRTEVFQIEYPCHSPEELRWYLARVTPLLQQSGAKCGSRTGAVVSHMNITDRKKLELEYARLASTDPLTGLPNRRYFDAYANIELERMQRFGGHMAVLMMDLDNFKLINDRHGHLAGDLVLKKFASRCQKVVRASDLFARIGGEEFVVLLAGTDEAGAMLLAERLRSAVEGLRIRTEDTTLRVTSSIGLASVSPRDRSINSALSRADRALYAAKNTGKNRVQLAA